MSSRWRPATSTYTELTLTESVAAVAPLVTVCLPLLARVCGKKARRETPFLGLLGSSISHILEPTVVDLAALARVAKARVIRLLRRRTVIEDQDHRDPRRPELRDRFRPRLVSSCPRCSIGSQRSPPLPSVGPPPRC